MAAGGSGGRASCPPGVGAGAAGGPGPSANAAAAPGNAAAAATPAPAAPGAPPPGSGPGAQAAAGGERAAEEPGAAALLREPAYNWQATKPTVQERFAFLFNNEVLCDVHFLVGKGLGAQRIPAHSPQASGRGDFVSPGPIRVPLTVSPLHPWDLGGEGSLGLYARTELGDSRLCSEGPQPAVRVLPPLTCVLYGEPAGRVLTCHPMQARLFDEPQLASLCLENIDKNTADAIAAEGFTDIDRDTLVAVLERDTLGVREVRLFNAVVRWSEAECQRQQLQVTPENKRKVLGEALALIRFPLMTIEEFAAGPAQSGILVDREVVSLFLHFTVNPKPRVDFIDRPRCCLRGKECSINRFQQVESRWGYSGTSDRIRWAQDGGRWGQGTGCATLKGPDSHYGTKGLRKVTHESPTTGAKTCFTFCYAAGNNNGTSVEDGQIPELIFYT
ncbi:BTB/POZ domain-containing protein 2 [Pteropus medius]|uniref:BTB/POZ domain-containing protein 2 n=1 Tax=Pteropus vampyrus TaxID=132908 RepID=UPI00196B0086|nr:BTB/POZ domain-containing protein 2 [Pteropus giganteus]